MWINRRDLAVFSRPQIKSLINLDIIILAKFESLLATNRIYDHVRILILGCHATSDHFGQN